MTTMRQLTNRRRVNRITRRDMQRRLACSYSWLRALEGGYEGPCVGAWRARYETALVQALADRQRVGGHGIR